MAVAKAPRLRPRLPCRATALRLAMGLDAVPVARPRRRQAAAKPRLYVLEGDREWLAPYLVATAVVRPSLAARRRPRRLLLPKKILPSPAFNMRASPVARTAKSRLPRTKGPDRPAGVAADKAAKLPRP